MTLSASCDAIMSDPQAADGSRKGLTRHLKQQKTVLSLGQTSLALELEWAGRGLVHRTPAAAFLLQQGDPSHACLFDTLIHLR